jgi:hypothetical protein
MRLSNEFFTNHPVEVIEVFDPEELVLELKELKSGFEGVEVRV